MTIQWNSSYFSKYTDGYLLFVSMPCFGQSFVCDFMKSVFFYYIMLGGLIAVVFCELRPKKFSWRGCDNSNGFILHFFDCFSGFLRGF